MTRVLLFLFLAAMAASPAPAQELDLDAALQRVMKGRPIPAMGVLYIRDNAVRLIAVHGVRAAGTTAMVTKDDLWHIGSDGKAMTATMIAKLVEDGKLSWDEPLPKLLPGVPMDPGFSRVTLLDLFGHAAGLPHDPSAAFLQKIQSSSLTLHEQRLRYAREILKAPPLFPPGTRHQYSNAGPILAAVAAEIATGQLYEGLMHDKIFEPLGMKSAAFGATMEGDNLGHDHGHPLAEPEGDLPALMAPAGEIHLTLADWAKFAIDQLKGDTSDLNLLGGGKLLEAKSYRLLHTAVPPLMARDPNYALGWGIQQAIDGQPGPFLMHAGSNGYWYATIVLCPSHRTGLLLVANAGEETGADKAENQLLGALLPWLVPAK